MIGGPSIVLTRKAVVDKTFIWDSKRLGKSIVGIDASQFYFFSICQTRPTDLYSRWELYSASRNFKLRQKQDKEFLKHDRVKPSTSQTTV